MEDAARFGAMLALVMVGLAVVALIFVWPLLLLKSRSVPLAVTLEVLHVTLLYHVDYPYLYLNRKVFLPIRRLVMPLVVSIAKSEAIREKEPTWYVACKALPRTNDTKALLSAIKRCKRKDLVKKFKIYRERGITSKTRHCDYLSLRSDIPVIWEHEKRATRGTDKSSVEEFVKRFLVIFLVSDAHIDRYYDRRGRLCALSMFVGNGNVLQNFQYFCCENESTSGIYMYNHFRGMLRAAASTSIDYANFHVHQSYAKRCAGAVAAKHNDEALMNDLYPFRFFQEPPENVVHLQLDLSAM